jgi:two-component system cell cycle response regulator
MSARILVVDDNPLNVKLLAAKLARDYYAVVTAENGAQALQKAVQEQPDIILLDVMMPEIDGFEVCKRLKADPVTRHIPVVMVTALSDVADRVRGLEAGADDFLTKPINDIALMSRVSSLLRLKRIMDEWRLREATAAQFAIPPQPEEASESVLGGQVLLLEDNGNELRRVESILQPIGLTLKTVATVAEALDEAQSESYDLVMTSLDLQGEDGLTLCGQLRANEATRTLPILLLANANEIDMVARGLDLGANDYLLRPLEGSELVARTRTQLRQKRHYDRLRKNFEQSLALALVDPLTGAFNRRYLDIHLPRLFARCRSAQKPVSILYLDIDHFKPINDTHGHPAGDVVLKEVVNRVSLSLRPQDLVVRLGGEEFAAILPEIEQKTALAVGERLRTAIAATPCQVSPELGLTVTISIGAASLEPGQEDTPEGLLKRADAALYRAKQTGRNRVIGEETRGASGV